MCTVTFAFYNFLYAGSLTEKPETRYPPITWEKSR